MKKEMPGKPKGKLNVIVGIGKGPSPIQKMVTDRMGKGAVPPMPKPMPKTGKTPAKPAKAMPKKGWK